MTTNLLDSQRLGHRHFVSDKERILLEDNNGAEIKVLIIDDHSMVAEALKTMLERSPRIRVVGVTSSAEHVLQILLDEDPDVLLLDVNMPEKSGFEIARELAPKRLQRKLLFITGYPSISNLDLAIRCNANGLISKNSGSKFLTESVVAVFEGYSVFDKELSSLVEFDEQGQPTLTEDSALSLLTDRQVQILIQLSKGLSTKQIAKRLYISAKTVDNHKYRIMKLLELHDRVELARFAFREGLVQP